MATPQIINDTIDREAAFGDRIPEILNNAGLVLMISIGHKTGLFDAMAGMEPTTSQQIAERTGLQERYVREWLAAMTTGGVIDFDAKREAYSFPEQHAAWLTRGAKNGNAAATFQFLPMLAQVEDQIIDCFTRGGGVQYEDYPHFHDLMAEESEQSVVTNLLEIIEELAPSTVGRLREGVEVLDIGCGRGKALQKLAGVFPRSRFLGIDLCPDAIRGARAAAESLDLSNLRFEIQDASALSGKSRFDIVTAFDAIHDQAEPARVLANARMALKPGGLFLMQDIRASSHLEKNLEHPLATFLYTISCMHCMSVSLAQGGEGLGTVWGEEKAMEMLSDAGFADTRVHQFPHDIQNNWYVAVAPRIGTEARPSPPRAL